MPQLNRTGPLGRGPMTGRGMGYCRQTVSARPEGERPADQQEQTVQDQTGPIIHGLGRGGIPYGCGRGWGGGGRRGRRAF